ncbi:hypothetical protein YC2023_093999 [Brassica napus]
MQTCGFRLTTKKHPLLTMLPLHPLLTLLSQGDLRCNVASFWILYNHHGETLLSRRTCTKLGYEVHVALLNLHWAIKSMMHLHFHRIIIEFSLTALRDVLSSPEFYPQYHNLFDDLQYMLKWYDWFLRYHPQKKLLRLIVVVGVLQQSLRPL